MTVLEERKTPENSREHQALCYSIVTAYARPFTRSDFGQIVPSRVIPAEFDELHRHIMRLRHEASAHSDGDPELALDDQPLNAVYLRVKANGPDLHRRITSNRFTLNAETLTRLSKLIEVLEKKAMYHQDKINKAHIREMPEKTGDFRLNIESDASPMWIPVKTPANWEPPK